MTQVIHSLTDWHSLQSSWQAQSQRIALVPTMGNLHEGHFSLVKLAQQQADKVVVSIFVNPLQFGPHEDFDRYPRTLVADVKALTALGVDVVFAPEVREVYPEKAHNQASMDGFSVVPPSFLTDTLCGLTRPGHFTGVATVVLKLFNIIRPQVAVFGEKDYQQLTIIKAMVKALNIPLQLLSAPTSRADDGLALSSRNQYLTPAQRALAPVIYEALQQIKKGLRAGSFSDKLIEQTTEQLIDKGFDAVDYVAIRHPHSLQTLAQLGNEGAVVLVAAMLGSTRLIDNLVVSC